MYSRDVTIARCGALSEATEFEAGSTMLASARFLVLVLVVTAECKL